MTDRIGFVADCHLGNHRRMGGPRDAGMNVRCRAALVVFQRSVVRAVELGCAAFVVLGDLFDYQRPEPQLLAAVQVALVPAIEAGMRVYLMVGNHDQVSDVAGDHALGPLAQPYADIVERPRLVSVGGLALALVPFRAGRAADWVRDAVGRMALQRPVGSRLAVGIHAGVRDDATVPWLRDAPDAVDVVDLVDVASRAGASAVLAGNWHDRRSWSFSDVGVEVLQLGALAPTGWDNQGLSGYGTLAVWDGSTIEVETIPGPRFVQSTVSDLATTAAGAAKAGHRLFAQVVVPPDKAAEGAAALDVLGIDGEVVLDGADVERQARDAAVAAAGATSVEGATAAFLESMPLPPGVDRDEVSAAVRGYLGLPGGGS